MVEIVELVLVMWMVLVRGHGQLTTQFRHRWVY